MGTLGEIKPRSPELGKSLSLLLDLKGKSPGFLQNQRALLAQALPALKPSIDDFVGIAELLDALGCGYEIDIASGRGFEYYTGVMFQFFVGGERVGSGGRYDALVPMMGGGEVPASGFALYIDRLMGMLVPETSRMVPQQRILIRAEPAEPLILKSCFEVAPVLREAGYEAELDLGIQGASEWRWLLVVRGEAPSLVLIDSVKGGRFEANSVAEVLRLLEECGAVEAGHS